MPKQETCYLALTAAEAECNICGAPVAVGLVGHSHDCPPQPICWACLAASDPKLTTILMLVYGMRMIPHAIDPAGDPDRLAKDVRELLRFIQTCLAEETGPDAWPAT